MHLLAIGSQPLKMLSQHSVKLITYLANLDSYSSAVQLIYIASSQLLPEKLWCSVFHEFSLHYSLVSQLFCSLIPIIELEISNFSFGVLLVKVSPSCPLFNWMACSPHLFAKSIDNIAMLRGGSH